MVATRCHILRLKCTKFDFSWGSAPDPTLGELSIPQLDLKGPTSKGKEGEGRQGSGEEARVFFFIFEHLWAPNRSWKISHGVPESPVVLSIKEWKPWRCSQGGLWQGTNPPKQQANVNFV